MLCKIFLLLSILYFPGFLQGSQPNGEKKCSKSFLFFAFLKDAILSVFLRLNGVLECCLLFMNALII